MGAYLQTEMLLPALALVSTSVRTRQTWDLLVQGLGSVPSLRFERRLYDAPAGGLASVIAETPAMVIVMRLRGCARNFRPRRSRCSTLRARIGESSPRGRQGSIAS